MFRGGSLGGIDLKYNSKLISQSTATLGHRLSHSFPFGPKVRLFSFFLTQVYVFSKNVLIFLDPMVYILKQISLLFLLRLFELRVLPHKIVICLGQLGDFSSESKAGRALKDHVLHLRNHSS